MGEQRWNKGQVRFASFIYKVYKHDGLYIIPTVNEILPTDFETYQQAENLVQGYFSTPHAREVIRYARENQIGRVMLACDIDPFLSAEGAQRIRRIQQVCRSRRHEVLVT